MRLLVLGGTAFVGRHIAEAALARGHAVAVLNRGRTAPAGLRGVEQLIGDRGAPGGLAALAGRRWDVVVDTCGYLPGAVRASGAALATAVDRYLFVSSISVYADFTAAGMDEGAPVQEPADPAAALTPQTYGGLKVACERALDAALPGRTMQVRAGLIEGPHDYDARFPWLLDRARAGGETLAPGDPEAPVQLIDVRDLADWLVRCAEAGTTGVYNATGPDPATPLTRRMVWETLRDIAGAGAGGRLTWVSDAFLVANGVRPYSELPFWGPPELRGVGTMSNARARAAGLTFRPFAETVADTWRWLVTQDPAELARRRALRQMALPAGMAPAREHELLARWAAEHAKPAV